jgi:hypothetical protein
MNLKSGSVGSEGSAELIVVYDLRGPDGWQAAHRHRASWGRRFADVHALGDNHITLVFRPAPDQRWASWERERLRWIWQDLAERGRAA